MILSRFRQLTLAISTILGNSYFASAFTKFVNINSLKGICVPVLNCYSCPSALFSCPIGTLQHFAAIQTIPFYLLGWIGLIGMAVGRMACGWVCPFGFLQDLMHKVSSPKYKVPVFLSYLKYVILIFLVVFVPYKTGEVWFSKLCPAGNLTAALPWALWDPVNFATGQRVLVHEPKGIFYVALFILAGFLIWFVLSKRPFCKVACPMGALFSFFNRYSVIRLEVSPRCDGCQICQTNCPMDLTLPEEVDSKECIRCLECTRCGFVKVVSPSFFPRAAPWKMS